MSAAGNFPRPPALQPGMIDDWDFSDRDEPDWPPAAAEYDDHAAPFSVAAATVAAMAAFRGLRNAWQRRGDTEDAKVVAPPAPPDDGLPVPDPQPPGEDARLRQLEADRVTLIELCVELDDLLTNEALRDKLRRGLRRVGVEAVEPAAGASFDPAIHRAVGALAAPDAQHDRMIASVERAGFHSAGLELRPPEVVVYRHETGARDD